MSAQRVSVRTVKLIIFLLSSMIPASYAQEGKHPLTPCERGLRQRLLRQMDAQAMALCERELPARGHRLTQYIERIYSAAALDGAPAAVRRQARLIRDVIAESNSRHMSPVRREYLQTLMNRFYGMISPDDADERVVYDQRSRTFRLEWRTRARTGFIFEGTPLHRTGPTETSMSCAAEAAATPGSVAVTIHAGEVIDHYGDDGWAMIETAYVIHAPAACDISIEEESSDAATAESAAP